MGKGQGRGFKTETARVHFDYVAYAAQHFPAEIPGRVRSAAHAIFAAQGKVKAPDPRQVWQRLEARGETRAQLEAKYGELA